MLGATASDERRRDIIPIALSLFDGMGGREPSAVAIDDQARQQTRRFGTNRQGALLPIGLEVILHDLPKLWIDNCFVLTRVDLALVRDLASVKPVLQHHEIGRASCRERGWRQ